MDTVKVAAVIPAYNEAQRIGAVLAAVRAAPSINDIIVVSDGSTDDTIEAARDGHQTQLVTLLRNVGKGGAMRAGAEKAEADILVFLDADLIGLTPEHVEALVQPVASSQADIAVGVFRGGRGATDLSQYLVPGISGQRALRREIFMDIPETETARFAIETRVNKYAQHHGLRVVYVPLRGVTHVMKEEKRGLVRGLTDRVRMYRDIALVLLRNSRSERDACDDGRVSHLIADAPPTRHDERSVELERTIEPDHLGPPR